MEHPEAISTKAAERYVLGDLSVSEVEEFERHFFDCPQCSEELRLFSILQDNARAVLSEQGPAAARATDTHVVGWRKIASLWMRPWAFAPALAAIAIAVFAGYQFGSRHSGSVEAISSYPLYAAARGSGNTIVPRAGANFFALYMDRTWDGDFRSYRAVLRDEHSERDSIPVAPPDPGRPIQVLIPKGALDSGNYTLAIFGTSATGGKSQVASYTFTLRFE